MKVLNDKVKAALRAKLCEAGLTEAHANRALRRLERLCVKQKPNWREEAASAMCLELLGWLDRRAGEPVHIAQVIVRGRGAIWDAHRRHRPIGRKAAERGRAIRHEERVLRARDGEVDDAKLAATLGTDEETLATWRQEAAVKLVKFEAARKLTTAPTQETNALRRRVRDAIEDANLTDRERQALAVDLEGLVQRDVAERMGCCDSRVHQLRRAAYQKLRRRLRGYESA